MVQISLADFLSWPTPDYTDPPVRIHGLNYAVGVLAVTMVIVVGLRFYTRIFVKRWFGIDDITIAVAMILALAFYASVLVGSNLYGWNTHIWDSSPMQATDSLKWELVSTILFFAAAVVTRSSLIFFFGRVVSGLGDRRLRIMLLLAHAVNFTVGIIILILFLTQCRPLSLFWQISIGSAPLDGTCTSTQAIGLAVGVMNVLCDLMATCLPLPVIIKLKMPRQQRLGTAFLLSLGFTVCIVDAVRTYYSYQSLASTDVTWNSLPLLLVAMIEVWLMIFCASAPSIRPLFIKLFGTVRSLSISSKSKSKSSHPDTSNYSQGNSGLSKCDCDAQGSCECYEKIEVFTK